MSKIINDYKISGERKIHLTIAIKFMSSKDNSKIRTMHAKSDNKETLIGNETDKIIEDILDSVLQKCHKDLEESMKGSNVDFDSVDLLHYKLQQISLNRGESYIDSPKWLKPKKATINTISNDSKCSRYATTVALNHKNIVKDPQRI